MFDWDEHNREHVQEHGVDPGQVEQALIDPDRIGATTESAARDDGRSSARLRPDAPCSSSIPVASDAFASLARGTRRRAKNLN